MSLTPHPFQEVALEQLREKLKAGIRRPLLQSSTGSGKTVMAALMLDTAAARGYRSWFLNHRREIIKQSVDTLLFAAPHLDLGIVSPMHKMRRDAQLQVCMIQTLARRYHLLPAPNLIVVDECHHVPAKSWADLMAKFPNAVIIGLTATPERLDGTGLNLYFDDLVCGPSTEWLIDNGYLCDYKLFAPPPAKKVDLTGVHMSHGDLNKVETAHVLDEADIVGDAVELYKQHANGKRNVVFTYSIESSLNLARLFNAAGIPASHLGSDTSDDYRNAIVEDFRAGRIRVLTNVEIVTEGFDLPAIECVQMLRPTRSLALYLQMVGRALRTMEGKRHAVIIDQVGNCEEHGLPDKDRIWTLEGVKRRRGASDECPVKQCPRCFAMLKIAATKCKWCGFEWQVHGRELDTVAGELVEVDVQAQRAQRKAEEAACKTMEEMAALGITRGYSNAESWARHKFRVRGENWRARIVNANAEKEKQAAFLRRIAGAPDDTI